MPSEREVGFDGNTAWHNYGTNNRLDTLDPGEFDLGDGQDINGSSPGGSHGLTPHWLTLTLCIVQNILVNRIQYIMP